MKEGHTGLNQNVVVLTVWQYFLFFYFFWGGALSLQTSIPFIWLATLSHLQSEMRVIVAWWYSLANMRDIRAHNSCITRHRLKATYAWLIHGKKDLCVSHFILRIGSAVNCIHLTQKMERGRERKWRSTREFCWDHI